MQSRFRIAPCLLLVLATACGRSNAIGSHVTPTEGTTEGTPLQGGAVPPSTGTQPGATGSVPPANPVSTTSGTTTATNPLADRPMPGMTTTAPTSTDTASTGTGTTTAPTGTTLPDTTATDTTQMPPMPMRGPTPAANGANFPFPQNRESPNCTYPTAYENADVVAAFDKWKADTVTSNGAGGFRRVQRPNEPGLEPNSTVSEGIAYGMLIAVYMNDQALFDDLWKYEQLWLDEAGLMHWYIKADGSGLGENPAGNGAASDADADMAWALVMADRQWGGQGSLERTYLDFAKETIGKIWATEIVDGKLLKPGDGWGGWDTVNISYFTPSYFRVFATVSENAGWNDVVTTSYDILEKSLNDSSGNTSNGLVPAWCNADGAPNGGVWGPDQSAPTHYQYDSCRTPFRIGLDYCFAAEARAQTYVQKTTSFFAGVGVANIVDGYELNGTPKPQESGGQSAAFIGPAGVGAMHDAGQQAFIDDAYIALRGLDLLVGGHYYEESWTVLSLLMMTGNFLDYTAIQPAQ